MDFSIKNIILYDAHQSVSGFVEVKIWGDRTKIKVRHDFTGERDLLLSVVADGDKTYVFNITGTQSFFEIPARLNPDREIFVSIIKRGQTNSNELHTMASGIINQDRKSLPIAEVDQILREVCDVEDGEKGICETCPYRDYFFGSKEIVVQSPPPFLASIKTR